jgi:hypothetical protein
MMRIDGRELNYKTSMRQDCSKSLLLLRLFLGHPLYWACQVFGWGGVWVFAMFHILIDPYVHTFRFFKVPFFFLAWAAFPISTGCSSG